MKNQLAIATCLLSSVIFANELKITFLGSSTVWGSGLLGEHSSVGDFDKYLKEHSGNFIMPKKMKFSEKPSIVKNRKFYDNKASQIIGKNSTVSFKISGDELTICQAIARTNNYGEITVYADGKKIGKFNNKNETLGEENKTFKGNGEQYLFPLGRCFTYEHKVTLDGKEMKFMQYNLPYVTGSIASRFPNYDGVVVRGKENKKVEHYLYFFNPPKGKLEVSYKYGETIGYVGATIGGTKDENVLESTFGLGAVPYDLANPTSFSTGLDFRYTDNRAFWKHKFDSDKEREIKLELTGGVNPYFMINFATNKNYQLQNAGIGGFTAQQFIVDKFNRRVEDSLDIFIPDVAFIILGGNDDWREMERLVSREIKDLTSDEVLKLKSMFYSSITPQGNGKFTAVYNAGVIDKITSKSLQSKQLLNTKAKIGNYMRIGNYYGDNNSTVVRRISKVDKANGIVYWADELSSEQILGVETLNDLVGADFTIRTLKNYTENITKMIEVLRKANPNVKIILLNTYVPDYFLREVWAYTEALEDIAKKYSNMVAVDVTPEIYKWIETTQLTGKTSVTLNADSTNKYKLPWKHHWQGFKVEVDGKDVYGKDCYISSGWYYSPLKNINGSYNTGRVGCKTCNVNLELVFTKNIPKKGTKIKVIRADNRWSSDFAHPNKYGCSLVAKVAVEAFLNFFNSRP